VNELDFLVYSYIAFDI